MDHAWLIVLLGAIGAWSGVLLIGMLAPPLLLNRVGREAAWPSIRILAPLVDLVGTWLGAMAAVALVLGRQGFSFAWAGALLLVALMATASLYDRAVLMPSLDAAFQRLGKGAEPERWEGDWAFLWRMAAIGRVATLCGAAGTIVCSLFA